MMYFRGLEFFRSSFVKSLGVLSRIQVRGRKKQKGALYNPTPLLCSKMPKRNQGLLRLILRNL
jgi:hypothetical protein